MYIMNTPPTNNIKRIHIVTLVALFFIALFTYSSVKNYFKDYFSRIEKKQDELMAEIKTIKSENKAEPVQPENTPLSLIQEVGKMKEEISKLKDEISNKNDVLGLLDTIPTPFLTPTKTESSILHFVTIVDSKWQTVDVFQDKNSSSRIIGQAVYNKYYPFTKKESEYYYIELSQGLFGWIHSQFVKEL